MPSGHTPHLRKVSSSAHVHYVARRPSILCVGVPFFVAFVFAQPDVTRSSTVWAPPPGRKCTRGHQTRTECSNAKAHWRKPTRRYTAGEPFNNTVTFFFVCSFILPSARKFILLLFLPVCACPLIAVLYSSYQSCELGQQTLLGGEQQAELTKEQNITCRDSHSKRRPRLKSLPVHLWFVSSPVASIPWVGAYMNEYHTHTRTRQSGILLFIHKVNGPTSDKLFYFLYEPASLLF